MAVSLLHNSFRLHSQPRIWLDTRSTFVNRLGALRSVQACAERAYFPLLSVVNRSSLLFNAAMFLGWDLPGPTLVCLFTLCRLNPASALIFAALSLGAQLSPRAGRPGFDAF